MIKPIILMVFKLINKHVDILNFLTNNEFFIPVLTGGFSLKSE